jgi:hypothetical protein
MITKSFFPCPTPSPEDKWHPSDSWFDWRLRDEAGAEHPRCAAQSRRDSLADRRRTLCGGPVVEVAMARPGAAVRKIPT